MAIIGWLSSQTTPQLRQIRDLQLKLSAGASGTSSLLVGDQMRDCYSWVLNSGEVPVTRSVEITADKDPEFFVEDLQLWFYSSGAEYDLYLRLRDASGQMLDLRIADARSIGIQKGSARVPPSFRQNPRSHLQPGGLEVLAIRATPTSERPRAAILHLCQLEALGRPAYKLLSQP